MIYLGLVITGTDTGVGKTMVGMALARLLRERGLAVGALKPVETGWPEGDISGADAFLLARSAGIDIAAEGWPGLDGVVPWRFPDPLAPEEAARLAGAEIGVDRIYRAMDRWMDHAEIVLVETAGGVMVPLNERFLAIDLLQGLDLPVLVVAANRLGVINHTLLTIEAIRNRGLAPVAVALNDIDPEPGPSADSNGRVIEEKTGVPVIRLPHIPKCGDPGPVADAIEPRLDELLKAVQADWDRVMGRHMPATK